MKLKNIIYTTLIGTSLLAGLHLGSMYIAKKEDPHKYHIGFTEEGEYFKQEKKFFDYLTDEVAILQTAFPLLIGLWVAYTYYCIAPIEKLSDSMQKARRINQKLKNDDKL